MTFGRSISMRTLNSVSLPFFNLFRALAYSRAEGPTKLPASSISAPADVTSRWV